MANSKSNIYPIQLQGAELCLNRYDAEIKQYRGFNKNNSPFVGGCLSNVFTKEEQIEGATDENTYIDTNGDKYTIDRLGLYKNGEKIIKYNGYASVFWEKEKITFPKDTVKVFADDLWLEKVTLGNITTYDLKSSHGLPEPASFVLTSNAGETEEELLNQNIDSLCIQARQTSWFILLRKTKAHNAQGNYYTGGVLSIYYFSTSQLAWIKSAQITISVAAYLKGLFFDSTTRNLMTFVSANGSNQMWVAKIVSTNNIEEIGLKTIEGATTNYTQNSVFYSYFPDLQTINYPYNAFILNVVRNGSNASTISSIPAMYINPYYDATNDLVKFRKIINLSMGTALYNWRHDTVCVETTEENKNTGTNTNLFRVYDVQISAQFQNSSQSWKSFIVHFNSEEVPNYPGYFIKNVNGFVTGNWTPGDYIKLGTNFHAAFNNNVLSGICGKYVLLTNWNTVKAEDVIYLEKWVPWDEPAGSLILGEAVLIKENDEYYLLRNGKPKIKHGLNQIITNADSYQNSYDTVRNKVLFFAPALNSFKTNYTPVDPSASSITVGCRILDSSSISSNPLYMSVSLNEYKLEDNSSILLNPVPISDASTLLQKTVGNLPDVFINIYSNRLSEVMDYGVVNTAVKYNYSSKFEDVYNASTFNNFKKKYDIDLIDLPFPIDTNGNVQYSPCLFGKVVSEYGNMAFYLEGAKGYPLMVSNNNQNVFSFYLGSEIENFETAFIIQGQYYGIIGDNIFFMQYQNGVVTGLSFIVSRKGLQFVGNTPYEALFYSPTNRCLYSFTGANVLNQKQLVDKISEVRDYLYNPATQTVFLITDIGVLFYGLFGMFLLEYTDISNIFLLDNGIVMSDNSGNYRYIKYYLDEGDTDYTKENINVETSFYGMNNEVVTINDCLYFRIFSEEHEEGDLRVSATTISLRGRKTEETTFKIKASDWDKITHTIYLRYQPKTQRGLGVAFAIDSPFKIASLSVGSQPDAVLVDKVSKGAITAPSVTTNNDEW